MSTCIVAEEESTNASSSGDSENIGIIEKRYFPLRIHFQVVWASRRRLHRHPIRMRIRLHHLRSPSLSLSQCKWNGEKNCFLPLCSRDRSTIEKVYENREFVFFFCGTKPGYTNFFQMKMMSELFAITGMAWENVSIFNYNNSDKKYLLVFYFILFLNILYNELQDKKFKKGYRRHMSPVKCEVCSIFLSFFI